MDKILTISIAAFNSADTIRETFDSLVNSGVLNKLEVIAVNDGSIDDTLIIINEYCEKYPTSFYLINKENGGWGSTVNASLNIATGRYFKLLDSDDTFDSTNLKEFVDYLEDADSDIIFTDFDYVYPNKIIPIRYEYTPRKNHPATEIQKILMHAIAVKTELIKGKVTLTEKCFYTDTEFAVKSMELSETFSYLPVKIYNYNMGSSTQSVSLNGYVKHAYDHERVLDVILPIVTKEEKFALTLKNHYSLLPSDQLYIFMLNKRYKDDFYRYYQKLKFNYPDLVKKMKIYIKISCKSPIFYSFFASILSRKVKP